jgi:hypothetical protein
MRLWLFAGAIVILCWPLFRVLSQSDPRVVLGIAAGPVLFVANQANRRRDEEYRRARAKARAVRETYRDSENLSPSV